MSVEDGVMTKVFTCRRESAGHYVYRGFRVICVGYYPPEGRVVWEAVDENGCGFAHSFRLRDTKRLIDESIENEKVRR